MKVFNDGLIHISVRVVEGSEALRTIVQALAGLGTVGGVSSVYRRFLPEQPKDLDSLMEFVLRLRTKEEAAALFAELLRLPGQYVGRNGDREAATFRLLAFEQQIQMTPQMTLPHPELHADPLIIRCAAEAWPTYIHPVLKKPLSELSKEAPILVNAEFWMQGQTLVDF